MSLCVEDVEQESMTKGMFVMVPYRIVNGVVEDMAFAGNKQVFELVH